MPWLLSFGGEGVGNWKCGTPTNSHATRVNFLNWHFSHTTLLHKILKCSSAHRVNPTPYHGIQVPLNIWPQTPFTVLSLNYSLFYISQTGSLLAKITCMSLCMFFPLLEFNSNKNLTGIYRRSPMCEQQRSGDGVETNYSLIHSYFFAWVSWENALNFLFLHSFPHSTHSHTFPLVN